MIQIDNIKLSLANETELRTVKMFSNGIFKGLQVPGAAGLDVNNLFNSMVKDYALYSVDDLFFGKVSIVGIYKSTTKLADIKNNFEFFQEPGEDTTDSQEEQEIDGTLKGGLEKNITNLFLFSDLSKQCCI